MKQNDIDESEWNNPDNWGGSKWFSIYFSKKDSRTIVPKQIPWTGCTLNFAKNSAVIWLAIIMLFCLLFPVLVGIIF